MIKVNLIMADGSELKEVYIFKTKELADSIVTDKEEIVKLFNENRTVWFSGSHVQGGLIPKRISYYEFIDDNEEVSKELLDFIIESSGMWDINYGDVRDWIMYNRTKLIEIIK